MKRIIQTPNAPQPVGPYNQAIQADRFLFISGQLPIDPKENKITTDNIRSQTLQVMENIKAILEEAKYTLQDIVQTTVYLSSMALFDDFNREYAKFLPNNYPARVTVACELKKGALLEVSAVAYKT
ncbi:MAG: Rid family detoxifying hydrolase [Candidatus Bathyarchaeota archaeon]|nr:Rid family detoxifying hydrolase [Candidatus Bathyarchaeota archaeon]